MLTLDGIDTSHFQTRTADPLPHLRFATTKASEGGTYRDPKFRALIDDYRRQDVDLVGAYHFLSPGATAKAQFDNFRSACRAVGVLDIYQVDWEASTGTPRFPPLPVVLEFEDRCRQEWPGKVLTYSAPWVTGFNTWLARPDRTPLWLADYSANALANARRLRALIVQYSSTIMIPGFTGRVDGNCIVDVAVFDATFATRPAPPVPPIDVPPVDVPPVVVPVPVSGDMFNLRRRRNADA